MLKSITWQSWATPIFGGQDLIPGSVTSFFSPKQVKKAKQCYSYSLFDKSMGKIVVILPHKSGQKPPLKQTS